MNRLDIVVSLAPGTEPTVWTDPFGKVQVRIDPSVLLYFESAGDVDRFARHLRYAITGKAVDPVLPDKGSRPG